MKRSLFVVLTALVLASLACSVNVNLPQVQVNVPNVETGETQTLTLNEAALDSSDPVAVALRMGMGELNLAGGAEGLVEGSIDYNVADWKPTVTTTADRVVIKQGGSDEGWSGSSDGVVNEWDIKLGAQPMELEITAGAYQGDLDLSGLALVKLTIQDGASDAEVTFDSVNPETMKKFSYETGASKVTLTGLANANFEKMAFKGGAGEYTLDFSGELQRDADVDITAGVSSVWIKIPAGLTAEVEVQGGLNSVSTQGDWAQAGDTYTCGNSGHTLTIDVEAGVGSVNLECED